jgi:hypothetical protein
MDGKAVVAAAMTRQKRKNAFFEKTKIGEIAIERIYRNND